MPPLRVRLSDIDKVTKVLTSHISTTAPSVTLHNTPTPPQVDVPEHPNLDDLRLENTSLKKRLEDLEAQYQQAQNEWAKEREDLYTKLGSVDSPTRINALKRKYT